MAVAQSPNIPLTTAWVEIASAAPQVLIQVVDGWSALVSIGAAAPAAGSTNGFRVDDTMSLSGLTTEKVYARASSLDRPAVLAVAKG